MAADQAAVELPSSGSESELWSAILDLADLHPAAELLCGRRARLGDPLAPGHGHEGASKDGDVEP